MIRSFGNRLTEELFHGVKSKRVRRLPGGLARLAVRKLDMLNAASGVKDLRSPPGNRFELLKGDLAGRYGIRINDRWRLVFRWEAGAAWEVTMVDYHG